MPRGLFRIIHNQIPVVFIYGILITIEIVFKKTDFRKFRGIQIEFSIRTIPPDQVFWHTRINYIEDIFFIEDRLFTIVDHPIINVVDANHCVCNARRDTLDMDAAFDLYFNA